MNKAILHGNVGKDPEIKRLSPEKKVARFSLATRSYRKDSQGNNVTDWHNIVCWDRLADLSENHIKKGSAIIVEGEIQYKTYQDNQGATKYITEILATQIHFAGKKENQSPQPTPEEFTTKDEFTANNKWQKGDAKKTTQAAPDTFETSPGASLESIVPDDLPF